MNIILYAMYNILLDNVCEIHFMVKNYAPSTKFEIQISLFLIYSIGHIYLKTNSLTNNCFRVCIIECCVFLSVRGN